MSLSEFLKKIEWLKSSHPYGSACVRINNEQTIYIDPSNLSKENMKKKADLILLTHSHDDHFCIETLEKLINPNTIIVCPIDCEEPLIHESFDFNIYIMKAGETVTLNRVKIEAIPAYSSTAHPITAGWLGFVIEYNQFRIYHSGDSGFIPEMNALKNIDIAFLTVREPYMMSPFDVINAINAFKPKILVPIHWIKEEKEQINYIIRNSPTSIKVLNLGMI
ncbi:MAG: MBL fold metallo-hydrolase [Promethearchaeota archaeon]